MQLQERTLNTAGLFENAVNSAEMQACTRARLVLVQPAKQLKVCASQTITSGPAGKAAEGLCSWQSSAVGKRYRLCSDARMYQTITSGVMAGSAGEAAEAGLCNRQAVRDGRAHNQRFIYSVFTKDTLDEKGQARDTRVNVKFQCFLT